ncbi:MAG: HAD family phosphatase [Planctomycetia bacterium]|nr:HAD family phosphatase [Planctomycetia bacterium]
MPRYRLLAIDIDGTLVNSRDELTPATRDALGRAMRHGIQVVLATGRRYRRALPLVEPLALDVPLVTASGALIKHPGDHRTLFCAQFDRDVLRGVLAVVERAGYEAVLYADTFDHGYDFYCCRIDVGNPELAEFFALNPDCHRLSPGLMRDPPPGIFAGFVMGTRHEMQALADQIEGRFPDDVYVHVLRSPRYTGYMCEIAPFGVTKWSGIERLAREWGIAHAEVCAVGDDVNDIPMIRAAGLGVAMGNAQEEVKQAADRVAPAHDDDGLAEVVEWLLGSNDE